LFDAVGGISRLNAGGSLPRPFRRIIAVVDGPNPSFDYYLAPRLRLCPGLEVMRAELREGPGRIAPAAFDGALLLFCRYITPAWVRLLQARRENIAAVALFLDDNLEALVHDRGVPLISRLRYHWCGTAHWPRLSPSLDLVLVSTSELARVHASARPLVLPPIADEFDSGPKLAPRWVGERFTVAYHATSIHGGDHAWLMPAAVALMKGAPPGWRFEVTAAGALARRWAECPGVKVVPPLPWPHYRQVTAQRHIDLMLAPLLPTQANRARSWTKRIDAARVSAALLVSDRSVYQPQSSELMLGMCVELRHEAWVAAIRSLAQDPLRRQRLAELNRQRVEHDRHAVSPLFERSSGSDWVLAPLLQEAEARSKHSGSAQLQGHLAARAKSSEAVERALASI
jgi:hypothetical protein